MSAERPSTRGDTMIGERKKRLLLGGVSQKLASSARPGYVRRWFNDTGNRLAEAKEAGYEFVDGDPRARSTDTGSRLSQVVGSQESGQGMRGYLMEKQEDWYREDMAEKQRLGIDERERSIKAGNIEGSVGSEGRYIPDGGQAIKIGANNRSGA